MKRRMATSILAVFLGAALDLPFVAILAIATGTHFVLTRRLLAARGTLSR